MSMAGLKYYLSDPKHLFDFMASRGLLNWMSDERYLKLKFKNTMGYGLNLDEPRTFNEKLQWLKLHDRKPLYTQLVDKYEVRKYIAEKIGDEYLIPLIGGPWDSVDEIDFDSLPEQFVLKCTHDSGGVVVCKDKSGLDAEAAKAMLKKRLGRNYYWANREWPYKDVKPRIIAEKYMEDESGELRDYKILCFNGEPRISFTCTERYTQSGLKVTFFDSQWHQMPFTRYYPASSVEIPKPENYDDMLRISKIFSEGMNFLRVDFYECRGKLYLGELTLYPGSGMESFQPFEWDGKLGDMIELSQKK